MRLALILLPAFICVTPHAFAAKLPQEPGQRTVEVGTIAPGKKVRVSFSAVLPATQKLNPAAPSYLAIYEKSGAEWTELKRVKLAGLVHFGDTIEVNEAVHSAKDDSEIAIHTTLYHCGKTNETACYIQGFQGIAKRAASGAFTLKFVAKATVDIH